MKTLLLTRSEDKNIFIMDQLKNYNFKYIMLPLIDYKNIDLNYYNVFSRYDNLIITSNYCANLIINEFNKYIKNHSIENPINIWIVGISSAEYFKNNKYFNISAIADTVIELIPKIPKEIYKDAIYISGDNITTTFPQGIINLITYNTSYIQSINKDKINEISEGINYAFLYSKKSAYTLIDIFDKYKLLNVLSCSIMFCISKNISDIIKPYCLEVYYTNSPDNNKILKMLMDYEQQN